MDSRVEILNEELRSLPHKQPIEATYYIERIRNLHGELELESDRVALLETRKILLDLFDRQVLAQRGDIEGFRNVRISEDRLICIAEAMEGDLINPVKLSQVVEREIAAGRMEGSEEFRQLASDGAKVLGDLKASPPNRKNWFSRFFFSSRPPP